MESAALPSLLQPATNASSPPYVRIASRESLIVLAVKERDACMPELWSLWIRRQQAYIELAVRNSGMKHSLPTYVPCLHVLTTPLDLLT